MIDILNKGSFYELSIRGPEPLFVRDFAIALIEELDSHQREYNNAKVSEARQFIEDRIVEIGIEMYAAEEALKDFLNRNRRIENSPALQLEQQRLSREVDVQTGVFSTLKQQLETTKIEEVKHSDYVIVLDPPEAPLLPVKTQKRTIVILAGILGIGFGVILGFIKEYLENSSTTDQEKLNKIKSLFFNNLVELIPVLRLKRKIKSS